MHYFGHILSDKSDFILSSVLDWNIESDADMSKSGLCNCVETFFAEEENHIQASCRASNLGSLHVNLEVESRSPQVTDNFTQMQEKDGIKDKIFSKNDLDR